MGLAHTDGTPLSDEEIKKLVSGLSIDPNFGTPSKNRGVSRMREINAALIRNAVPIGGMTAGAEGGAALATALAPESFGASLLVPTIGAAIGSGLANVGNRKLLPEDFGGDPKESAKRAFATGAIAEGVGRGIAGALEGRALKKGAEGARTSIVDALKGEDVAAQDLEDIESVFGRKLKPSPALTLKEGGGDLANTYRDAVTGPIDRLRDEYGSKIGKAYDALKGNDKLADVEGLRDRVNDIRSSMRSPLSERANSLLAQVKRFDPKQQEEEAQSIVDKLIEMPGGELKEPGELKITPQNLAAQNRADAIAIRGAGNRQKLGLQNFTDKQIAKIEAKGEKAKPATLDNLREMRQKIQDTLRTSQGGDRYALAQARDLMDQRLVDYLPDNMGDLRRDYKNFMRRFPYSDINRLQAQGTSSEVAKYAFGGDPEITRDIVTNAKPNETPVLKRAFSDHVLRNVNPDLPPEEQLKQISKAVDPYIQNGVLKDLYGSTNNDALRSVLYAPIHRVRAAKLLEQPKQIAAFDQGYLSAIKGAKGNKRDAAERGLQYFVKSLPPAERARFQAPSIPGVSMPIAPTGQESIAAGLSQGLDKPGQMVRYGARRAQFGVPMAGARMAMGGGGVAYGAATAATFGTIAATSAGYRALMTNGGADWAARIYASQNGRTMGRMAFEALAAMGAQASQQ